MLKLGKMIELDELDELRFGLFLSVSSESDFSIISGKNSIFFSEHFLTLSSRLFTVNF